MALLLSNASAQAAKAAAMGASSAVSDGSDALGVLHEGVSMGEEGKPEKRTAEEPHGDGAPMDPTGPDMAERLAVACASVAATIAAQSLREAKQKGE